MMTKVNGTRYEFIFIRLEPVLGVSREMVDLVGAVCKAYVSTRLYRDLRLRSAILAVSSKQLKMLQSEQIYISVGRVWNLSSDQGNLGTMYLTNVRVVWHANMNELFNISLPFIQVTGKIEILTNQTNDDHSPSNADSKHQSARVQVWPGAGD